MNVLLYITVNLLLFSSWYIFLFQKKESLSFPDRIVGTFILGLSQIIVTEMLLGILIRQLFAMPLFLLNSVISIILIGLSLFICKRAKNRATHDPKHFFNDLFREIADKTGDLLQLLKNDTVLLLIFSLFITSMAWIVLQGVLFPSYTWDALWYHLPIVGYIIESGAIKEIPNYFFIQQFINIFPKNIELYFLWNIIFLKNDIITDLSLVPFLMAGMFSIYSIALKVNIQQRHALYSSFLFFFTPIIILQATTNYVDIGISTLFIMAVNFLIHDGRESLQKDWDVLPHVKKRKLHLLMGGIATGILLGAKGSGPLFVVILSAVVIVQKLRKHLAPANAALSTGGDTALKSMRNFLCYFLLPAVALGGYWYGKNWIIYDNPVYPMEITIFGKTIFKGLYKGMIEPAPEIIKRLSFIAKPLYVWVENIQHYLYDSRLGGLGPLWFILFLPSLAFTFTYSLVKRKYSMLAVISIFIAAFIVYPRNWTPRYVIFIVGLGAVTFSYALDYFNGKRRVLQIIALSLAVYTFLTSNSLCVTADRVDKLMALPPNERTVARMTPFNIDMHARQDYGYWIWISDNILEGDTLAYTFEPLFLSPLWNPSYTSRISYVKADTLKEWTGELTSKSADYILIRTNSIEDTWVEKEMRLRYSLRWLGTVNEMFRVVYSDQNYKILKFNEGKG